MADVKDLSRSLLKSTILVQEDDYTGPMTKNYMRNGHGEQKFPNGDRYTGSFKNDLFEGKGVYRYANGNEYEGSFKRGLKEGKGEFRVKQKAGFDLYVGGFKKGLKEGKFTVKYANGDVYVGTYVKDKKAHGKLTYSSGAVYEGEFGSGGFSGKGVFTKPGEFVYKGDFKESGRHGWGVETQGRDKIKVAFERNQPNGKGVIVVGGKRVKNVWVASEKKEQPTPSEPAKETKSEAASAKSTESKRGRKAVAAQ